MNVDNIHYELRPRKAVEGADLLIEMKKKNTVWEVIAKAIEIWSDSQPEKWNSALIDIKDVKETRKDKKFGTSKSKNSNLRHFIDLPEPVFKLIRALYHAEELPMNKEFFQEFGKRFPAFKVVEKI